MLDHVSLPVADLDRAAAFYDRVLATIGLARRAAGAATPGIGLHVSFVSRDHASVDAFHAAALAAGGTDAGAPGPRPEYTQPFYGAFVLDPDGFKVEAVCRQDQGSDARVAQ